MFLRFSTPSLGRGGTTLSERFSPNSLTAYPPIPLLLVNTPARPDVYCRMQDNLVGDGPVQPEIVLPEQFFASIGGRVPLKAEYQLAAAVLQEAVECYQKHLLSTDSKGRVLFTDAQAWIDADDWDWPFSFLNICAIVRIDPDYLRGGLRAWHQREAVSKPRATLLSMPPPASGPLDPCQEAAQAS